MPHQYELHIDLLVQCACCRSRQPFRFASASDQVVCAFCRSHLGAEKAERRDRAHIGLWLEQYTVVSDARGVAVAEAAAAAAESAATIAELHATVAVLTAAVEGVFDATSAGGIRAALENDLVRRAERRTELVSRRLDHAVHALAAIDRLHHDAAGGVCSCGAAVTACAEHRAVEPLRAELRRAREQR